MIDPNRFPLPNVLAMANRLAEMRKQTEMPPFVPFREAVQANRTDDLIAAALAAVIPSQPTDTSAKMDSLDCLIAASIAFGRWTAERGVTADEAARVWREVREVLQS